MATERPFDPWSLRESAEALLLVAAALETGLLLELESERMPEEAARALGLDARATGICLAALEAVGVVERVGPAFRLTAFGRTRFADPESAAYVAGDLVAWRSGLPAWLFLGDVLRSGSALARDASPEARARVYLALDAKPPGRVAAVVDAALARVGIARPRVLDLGGGSGIYARGFLALGCPVTLLDRPETVRHVREAFGLERLAGLTLVEGDLGGELPGGPFEVALLADVIHELPAESVQSLLARLSGVMAPGGVVAVVDLFRGRSPRAALYAVTLLLCGDRADTHEGADVVRWLAAAGFRDARFQDLDTGRSLLTARRPDAATRRSG